MPEDLYPRLIQLPLITAFQASHAYSLGNVVKPTTPNSHIYYVTTAGTSSSEPSWPTSAQGTIVSGTATFTEHGLAPGVQHEKYLKRPKDWAAITVISEFEDGGKDYLERAADAPQFYELDYNGLMDEDAYILDAFWESHRLSVPFTFVEIRNHPWTFVEGSTVASCHFVSFDRDHDRPAKGVQRRKVVIAKWPA